MQHTSKSLDLSFASLSIANVVLIFFLADVSQSPPVHHRAKSGALISVWSTTISASPDLCICILLSKSVVDERLSQFLAKGYEFQLLTLEVDPCKEPVDFSDCKNEPT